jgi:hypothetical protein
MEENLPPYVPSTEQEIPSEVSYSGRRYILDEQDKSPNETTSKKNFPKAIGKVFLFLLVAVGIVVIGLPLLGFLFCLLVVGIGGLFGLVLPSIVGIYSLGIVAFSIKKLTKKRKKQFYSFLPYFIGLIFFSLLYLGGIAHQETNVCSLVSPTTLLVKPLLSYAGMLFSGFVIFIKTRKL